MAANSVRCPAISGECVRGGILPFHLRGAARAAGRRISAGTPTGSVARQHGNADLRSAQPRGSAAGETDLKQRHGPYSNGYFNRSGGRCGTSRQSAVRGSPACGGRCRPEVGVPSRPRDSETGGYASLAGLRPAVPVRDRRSTASPRFNVSGDTWVRSGEIGGAQRCWCGFRAPARCRSEAPTGRTGSMSP